MNRLAAILVLFLSACEPGAPVEGDAGPPTMAECSPAGVQETLERVCAPCCEASGGDCGFASCSDCRGITWEAIRQRCRDCC